MFYNCYTTPDNNYNEIIQRKRGFFIYYLLFKYLCYVCAQPLKAPLLLFCLHNRLFKVLLLLLMLVDFAQSSDFILTLLLSQSA